MDYYLKEWVVWLKSTKHGKLHSSNGYLLTHQKEICLIGVRGRPALALQQSPDVIEACVRQQSAKRENLHVLLEKLSPAGRYLELFGRSNNVRSGWTTLGDQLDEVIASRMFRTMFKSKNLTANDLLREVRDF